MQAFQGVWIEVFFGGRGVLQIMDPGVTRIGR